MRTIDDYLDAAKSRQGFKSDRELCKALGIRSASISAFRTKRAWPTDAHMIRLAHLAGWSEEEALLDVGRWRAMGTPAAAVYERLLKRLVASAAALLLAVFVTPHPAGAAERDGNIVTQIAANTVYYGKKWLRLVVAISMAYKRRLAPRLAT